VNILFSIDKLRGCQCETLEWVIDISDH